MKGIDYKTGHIYDLAADGSGELHADDCSHWSHGMSPFGAGIFLAGVEEMRKALANPLTPNGIGEIILNPAQQLLEDFHADTHGKAIAACAPNPPDAPIPWEQIVVWPEKKQE